MKVFHLSVKPYSAEAKPWLRACVRIRYPSGKIGRRFFHTMEEAEYAAKGLRAAMESVSTITPNQLRSLLDRALSQPDMVATIALGAFGGFNPLERKYLSWENINLSRLEIVLGDERTKPRTLKIEPTLGAWLKYVSDQSVGEHPRRWVRSGHLHRRMEEVVCASGLSTLDFGKRPRRAEDALAVPDLLYHSYYSYHLAKFRYPSMLYHQAGGVMSGQELLDRYTERVTVADAEAWWQILPPA